MTSQEPSSPVMHKLVAAISDGDRDAFLAMLTPDATLTDDGNPRSLHDWIDREIFSAHGHMNVEQADPRTSSTWQATPRHHRPFITNRPGHPLSQRLSEVAVPGESAQTILDELHKDLNDLITAHGFACMGLRRLREYFASTSKSLEDPDPVVNLADVVPDNPDWPKDPGWLPRTEWRLSDAVRQVQDDGPVETLLGQQWIVSVYALWEEEYRPRLAEAHGRTPTEETYPLLGDLRRLRHDVIHHRGIASAGN